MECPVCLDEDIDVRACHLRCGHHLCNRCITRLEHPLCPVCRAPIFPPYARAASPPAALDPSFFSNPDLMDVDVDGFLPGPEYRLYWHFSPSRPH